ncbi:MAG: F0F1 ATP synthase subunit delta [Gammaproteobacteria bacterium TMED92]|nr:MAG: F0F1 ATP synthase subunit delta [Gammaproteobacteria bacterium TMED92]
MAELATIARPYANAVFDLARANDALDEWSRMLGVLAATSQDETVAVMLVSPDLAPAAKAAKLGELCAGEVDDQAKKFLLALADHDRLTLLGEVVEQYEARRAEALRSLDVKITAAYELSAAQTDALVTALGKKFDKEIALESSVDASLMGGAIIRAGDVVIDGSVRGRLTKLVDALVQI